MPAKAARRAEGKKNAGRRSRNEVSKPEQQKKHVKPGDRGRKRPQNDSEAPPPKRRKLAGKKGPGPKSSRTSSNLAVKAAQKAAAKTLQGKVQKPVQKAQSDKSIVEPAPKIHRKERLKGAVSVWEILRRHDVPSEQRTELVATALKTVQGRVAQVATSPKGSRVLQACVKHGSPEQRSALLEEALPHVLELSKGPYSHFLICKLLASAPKDAIPGLQSKFKGHIATLLRHPTGAAVIDELYNISSAGQRNRMASEFYGKEYTLLSQDEAPGRLSELLKSVDVAKRRLVVQRMALQLIPIMEKAIVDPVLTHRLLAEYIEAAPASARQDAWESVAGEPLLRMVHTRDGAWVACSLLSHGTAKHCKKFIKALKGHVETMAKDRWGSLVVATALSNVDDTVLLRKVILPTLQEKAKELMEDRHAHAIYLQLLAPDKQRYFSPDLQAVIHPKLELVSQPKSPANEGEAEPQSEIGAVSPPEDAAPEASQSQRKKDARQRQAELLGSGSDSLAAEMLSQATANAAEWLSSSAASDILVELCCGGCKGVLVEHHLEAVQALQAAVAVAARPSPNNEQPSVSSGGVIDTAYGSRALRRMILALQDTEAQYSPAAVETLVEKLREALKTLPEKLEGHANKVAQALAKNSTSGPALAQEPVSS